MATFEDTASGGLESGGMAYAPFFLLDEITVGESCTGHSDAEGNKYFCCLLGIEKEAAVWRKMNGAYVPAITVCTMRLF